MKGARLWLGMNHLKPKALNECWNLQIILKIGARFQICSHRRPTTMILTIPVLNPQSRDKKTFLVLLLALCPGGGIVKMVKHR